LQGGSGGGGSQSSANSASRGGGGRNSGNRGRGGRGQYGRGCGNGARTRCIEPWWTEAALQRAVPGVSQGRAQRRLLLAPLRR
jgi:hypothetical protein